MKILQVNNHNGPMGGTEKYFHDLCQLLESNGNQVAVFSSKSKNNIKSKWDKYFSKEIPMDNINYTNVVWVFINMIYSTDSRKKISALLDDFKPDIVHVHNIYHYISPSILYEIKRRNIPCVCTLHDYNLITPNNTFFHQGAICEIPREDNFLKTLFHRCVRGSFVGTFITLSTLYFHRMTRAYEKNIDVFVSPSNFLIKKFKEYNFDTKKIIHIPNFSLNPKTRVQKSSNYVLYFGQVSDHKGINLIISSAKLLSNINFKIIGDGPLLRTTRKQVKEMAIKNVKLIGSKSKQDIVRYVQECSFVIVPSLWYENAPLSIIESFALGKPVIASKIGGIPELVNNKNGFLFNVSQPKIFAKQIKKLWENKNLQKKLGKQAKKDFLETYSGSLHYRNIINIYKNLVYEEKK